MFLSLLRIPHRGRSWCHIKFYLHRKITLSHSGHLSFPFPVDKPLLLISHHNIQSVPSAWDHVAFCSSHPFSSISHPTSHKVVTAVIAQLLSTGLILVKKKSITRPWRTNKYNQNLSSLSQICQRLLLPDHKLNYLSFLRYKSSLQGIPDLFSEKSVDFIIWRNNFLRAGFTNIFLLCFSV